MQHVFILNKETKYEKKHRKNIQHHSELLTTLCSYPRKAKIYRAW